MECFLEQLGNGLSKGSIFALIAVGYTMVYGVIRLINFAHGEFVMVAAFVGFFTLGAMPPSAMPLTGYWALGASLLLAAALATLVAGVLAVVVERVAYRPIRNAGRIAALLTAIGVSLLLQNLGIQFFGAADRAFIREWQLPREYFPISSLAAGDMAQTDVYFCPRGDGSESERELPPVAVRAGEAITAAQLNSARARGVHTAFRVCALTDSMKRAIIVGSLIACSLLLHALVRYTGFGRAMRAVSYDRDAARLMGINVDRVISMTFFIGAAVGGIGGVLMGLHYNSLDPLMGFLPGLKAFVAAVLGGIGSVPGALVGGLMLGVVEDMVVGYGQISIGELALNLSTYRDAVAYAVLILILLFRPQGILGKEHAQKL